MLRRNDLGNGWQYLLQHVPDRFLLVRRRWAFVHDYVVCRDAFVLNERDILRALLAHNLDQSSVTQIVLDQEQQHSALVLAIAAKAIEQGL